MEYDIFDEITKKYGYWSSWAIWGNVLDSPKSNVGDLTIFHDKNNIDILKPNIILVGLNISRGAIKEPLANFHDKRSEATDFKIRYALRETPIWGAYMTDLIKDFDQKESGKVIKHLRENTELVFENINIFEKELQDLQQENYILIAFGRDVYSLLKKYFKERFKILHIPHYASYCSKERYRDQVLQVLNESGFFNTAK